MAGTSTKPIQFTGNRRDEMESRIDLACAHRAAAKLGYHEGICNHMTVMVPGRRDRFLIGPKGMHWADATASKMLVIDDKGKVVEGEGSPSITGYCIHTRIHLNHPNAGVVLHTHMPYATALTAIKGGRLEMMHQNAARFFEQIAYDDDFNGFALSTDEGDRMAKVMGNRNVLFLGNHGVVVVGPTVADAFDDLYYIERACMVQVLAMSTGRPLQIIPDDMCRVTRDSYTGRHTNAEYLLKYYKDTFDREEPEYAS